jgi:hypothetical protein
MTLLRGYETDKWHGLVGDKEMHIEFFVRNPLVAERRGRKEHVKLNGNRCFLRCDAHAVW